MKTTFRSPFATRGALLIRNAQHPTQTLINAALIILATVIITHRCSASTNYVAHEWGTFTSVQGSNGNLLPWRPIQLSELPKFVYSSKIAGSELLVKPSLITYQRLETPVIYFYSQDAMKVTADVRFPQGLITEWFPNVSETSTGHSITNGTNITYVQEGHAVWRDIDILGAHQDGGLPRDTVGSHYFAARATNANLIRATTTNATELEKFIFYRGAGNFKTPLRVTVDGNNVVSVENTGDQPLAHLFLLNIHDGTGAFAMLDELTSSNSVRWQSLNDTAEHWNRFDLARFQTELGAQVQIALTSAGLNPDEAQAMVNTWRDSWFTEDGVRVLYLLPRQWTDGILPLTLTPQPTELTRVMFGRAEVITPQVETRLFQLLSAAQAGDTDAKTKAVSEFKRLGRFSEPALQLALSHTNYTSLVNFSYQLLRPPQPASIFE